MMRALLATVVCVFVLDLAAGLTCDKNLEGEYEFFEDEEKLTNKDFNCMRGSTEVKAVLKVGAPTQVGIPQAWCNAVVDKTPHLKTIFEKVEISTGIKCKYECREHPKEYRCQSKPFGERCPCEHKPPSVIVKPVASELGAQSILGQSDVVNEEGELTCVGKEEGFQFPDAVSCIGIRADVLKKRVHFKKGHKDKCYFEISSKSETRYAKSDDSLQGCMYVCKQASPRCTVNTGGKHCDCKSSGLVKQLVPLGEAVRIARIVQQTCETGQCGPCGECVDGLCQLIAGAHMENRCSCGEICPLEDRRRGNYGGQILCEPNSVLDCMAKPEWQPVNGVKYEPGTIRPDFCTEGETQDLGDTCGCAPGYIQKPGDDPTVENFVCVKAGN